MSPTATSPRGLHWRVGATALAIVAGGFVWFLGAVALAVYVGLWMLFAYSVLTCVVLYGVVAMEDARQEKLDMDEHAQRTFDATQARIARNRVKQAERYGTQRDMRRAS